MFAFRRWEGETCIWKEGVGDALNTDAQNQTCTVFMSCD